MQKVSSLDVGGMFSDPCEKQNLKNRLAEWAAWTSQIIKAE